MEMKKFCRNNSDAQDKIAETTTDSDTDVLPVKYDMMFHSHYLAHACVVFVFLSCWLVAQHSTAQIWVMGWN